MFFRGSRSSAVVLAFCSLVLAASVSAADRKLVYGLVPNAPPTTFLDGSGKPTGFFVELFSRIMDELGIEYEYRVANFQDLYPQLVAGKVDFFTALQRTPERASLLVFPEHAGVAGWGQLFIAEDAEIDTVLDLQHQRIGVVAEDQTGGNFRAYIDSLAIPCEIVEFPDFEQLVRSVQSGAVFGGVQSNMFVASERRVKPTTVVFAPFRSYPVLSRESPFGEAFAAVIRRYEELSADPESYYYELQAKWFGREPVETVVAPVWLVVGFIGFFAIALVCVLVIRALTRRLRLANRELERRVQERTAQLVRAERMASLGSLVANIAHELNSPLQALRAGITLLRSSFGGLPGEASGLSPDELSLLGAALAARETCRAVSFPHSFAARRHVAARLAALGVAAEEAVVALLAEIGLNEPDGKIAAALAASSEEFRRVLRDGAMRLDILGTSEASIDQMDSVIRALRLFAHRSEEGKTSVVSLSGQIDAVLALNADRLRSGVGVIRDYGELPDYVCREEQLQQVWMNLVNNSLEAMGAAGTLIIVGSLDSGGVRVSISDTGPGIPPEIAERIFDPLFTTKPQGTATGLGLSVAQDVVHSLGGSISFESVPGRTVFTVILPAAGIREPQRRGVQ